MSCPRIRLYMLLRPNTLRKYQEAELTLETHQSSANLATRHTTAAAAAAAYQDASSDSRSMPRCNMGLNLSVRGNGTLAAQITGREEKSKQTTKK